MKRQIILIIMLVITACSWGFVSAAEPNVSLTQWMNSRKKPITLTKWINQLPKDPLKEITNYRNPSKTIWQGNIVAEQYLVTLQRELDILRMTIAQYRSKILEPKGPEINNIWWDRSTCQWLTNLDMVALMSRTPDFIIQMWSYPMVTIEQFTDEHMDRACTRWSACRWWNLYTQVQQRTTAQQLWPLCYTTLSSEILTLYQMQLGAITLQDDHRFNSAFINGSGTDSIFDITFDMNELASITLQKTPKPIDTTKIIETVTSSDGTMNAYLPDELIASTQQLVNLLESNTTVDPRQDAQINSLIGQLTTISTSTATIPTGSILNACIAPELAASNIVILQQLRTTQQAVQQYNTSLNTDQSLNNVINGTANPADFAPTTTQLSALVAPTTTAITSLPIADLSANPLGSVIAQINDEDLWAPGWWDGLTGDPSGPLGWLWTTKWWPDTIKQCLSSCVQQYDNNKDSPCVIKCESQWQIGWLLAARACNQQCFNAKIACQASCLCNSTSAIAQDNAWTGEIAKVNEMFETRRCVVPTNKLRNPVDSSCIRVDPETWVIKWPSIECLLDKTIDVGTNAREWGKWWLRVNPKEWFQLPNKFDLKAMLRFPINIISAGIREDKEKKKDIEKAKNQQTIAQDIAQDPSLTATKMIGSSQEVVQAFINSQIDRRKEAANMAQNKQWIVTK